MCPEIKSKRLFYMSDSWRILHHCAPCWEKIFIKSLSKNSLLMQHIFIHGPIIFKFPKKKFKNRLSVLYIKLYLQFTSILFDETFISLLPHGNTYLQWYFRKQYMIQNTFSTFQQNIFWMIRALLNKRWDKYSKVGKKMILETK